MCIEQIIEFKLRGPWPLSHYMYSYNRLFSWPVAQHVEGNVPYFFLPGPNHIQNLTPNCKILNVFWTWIVGKKRIEQFNFSIGFLSRVVNGFTSSGPNLKI